ncbi:MAG: alpha amylase C-terminal domain-containing protein, partial [Clostridia bacterium]|nr:alpha amylase C-terminal domain-containing protein [Clostridia bacterium]
KKAELGLIHNDDKVIIYSVGSLCFAFNFHPEKSFSDYPIPTKFIGDYRAILSSDESRFGGFDRVDMQYNYFADKNGFKCYLPSRTVTVFKKK